MYNNIIQKGKKFKTFVEIKINQTFHHYSAFCPKVFAQNIHSCKFYVCTIINKNEAKRITDFLISNHFFLNMARQIRMCTQRKVLQHVTVIKE